MAPGSREKVIFRIGISAGQPVTENDGFFGETIKLAYRLSYIARENQILISSMVSEITTNSYSKDKSSTLIKAVDADEESFITSLFKTAENSLSNELFTVDALSRSIGISRPQLYRKVTSIAGRSPNELLRNLRLDKAKSLLRKNAGNISQVALEVGYSNPSYFAKAFTQKFGCSPSKFAEMG